MTQEPTEPTEPVEPEPDPYAFVTEPLDPKKQREWLLHLVNMRAREVFECYQQAQRNCVSLAMEKRELARIVGQFCIEPKERRTYLDTIYRELTEPVVSDDSELLECVSWLVQLGYKTDKWSGREADNVVRKLLGRIDPALLQKYDEF